MEWNVDLEQIYSCIAPLVRSKSKNKSSTANCINKGGKCPLAVLFTWV